MSKLFCHIDTSTGFDPRIEEIPNFIIDYFDNKLGSNSTFYILDPYLRPYEMIYEQVLNRMFDNKSYVKVLKSFCEIDPLIEVKILTEKDIKPLKDKLPKEKMYPNDYARFNFNKEQGRIEVVRYPSKDGKFPEVLHDRWLILKSGDKFSGLHLGPSLEDFKNKDCTITIFDESSAKEVGKRFEHIWSIYAGWII